MRDTLGVLLAGGAGERLFPLTRDRAKPAVPFGGKYRIIDFTLSNCVNSDVDNVVVLTQYNPRSLNDHIGMGRPWDRATRCSCWPATTSTRWTTSPSWLPIVAAERT